MKKFLLLLGLVASTSLQAQISFDFTYADADGVGFNDATLGAARRAELESAMAALAAYFNPFQPVTLTYRVASIDEDGTLANAGSNSIGDAAGFFPSVVQHKIITGVDANGSDFDGGINFNFAYNWGFGSTIAPDAFDFFGTAMHEGLHSFGFLSYLHANGTADNDIPAGQPDSWLLYDSFITDAAGNHLIDDTTFAYNIELGLDPLTSGLFFNGANAMAAYGGNPVPLYAPGTWSDGSSASHLDDGTFTNTDPSALDAVKMMNAAANSGPGSRELSALELAILQDLGYDVKSAVPEPSTYALLAFGAVLLSFAFRSRARATRRSLLSPNS